MKILVKATSLVTLVVILAIVPTSLKGAGFEDVPGLWQMEGYGRILEVTDRNVTTYDITDISCMQYDQSSLPSANKTYDRIQQSTDHFTAYDTGGITRYGFQRIEELPGPCKRNDPAANDPLRNFDILARAFRENYAFFNLRGVDWDELVAQHRSRISPDTNDNELFKIMSDLIGALHDGHVVLESSNNYFDSGDLGAMEKLWDRTDGGGSYYKAIKKMEQKQIIQGKTWKGAKGMIKWGWAAPGIGYVSINTMELPGDPAMPAQFRQVDKAMVKIVNEFTDARSLIVDARFNDGGYDSLALHIMGYLTTETRLAFTKKARFDDGHTTPQEVYYGPVGAKQLTCPIVYLQSGSTISAAEIFTMAMMVRPNTVSMGQNTYGVLSDMLDKDLPNGWWVTISNEVYTAADGNLYEATGIPPEVDVSIEPGDDFFSLMNRWNTMALDLAEELGNNF